jgi:PadR family transcriptional regulator
LNPKYEQQMKKGVLEMLVLKLILEEEKYGYQLLNELKSKSDGMFTLKEGTLYPILYRLEEDGMVISSWSEPKGKEVSRKYYAITQEGIHILREMSKFWSDFSCNVTDMMEVE